MTTYSEPGYSAFEPTRRQVYPFSPEKIEIVRELPRPMTFGTVLMRVASVAVALIGPLGIVLFAGRSNSMGMVMLVAAGAAVILGSITVYAAWRVGGKETRSYFHYLDELHAQLRARRAARQTRLADLNLPPTALQAIIRDSLDHRRVRLWERRPDPDVPEGQRDFLTVRIGTAVNAPTGLTLGLPSQIGRSNQPGLVEQRTLALRDEFVHYHDETPVTIALADLKTLAIVGDPQTRMGVARAILAQIATFHAPHDVALTLFYPEARTDNWFWAGWLPHTRRSGSLHPMLACTPARIHDELRWLNALVTEREEASRKIGLHTAATAYPTIIVLLDDHKRLQAGLRAFAHAMITGDDSQPDALISLDPAFIARCLRQNVIFIYLVDHVLDVPPECRAVCVLHDADHATCDAMQPSAFTPDSFSPADCTALAQNLAPIRILSATQEGSTAPSLPTSVNLLNLLAWTEADMQPERLLAHWVSKTHVDLRIVLGIGDDGKPLILDLDESRHGPHGMLIGRTGSGKGELLLTIVANLALNNHPESLNLLLADFKGGATFNVFDGLPHCVGNVTNHSLSTTHDVERFLEALLTELKRREAMIAEAQRVYGPEVQKIGQYRQIAKDLAPMPYLIVIIDEFATMKEIAPQRIRDLIEIGNKGRSAGVFLLLAMQSPQGVIPDKLAANLTYRLALKVNAASDSTEVIGTRAAADSISGEIRGRGFFRCNTTLKMFQGARVMDYALSRRTPADTGLPLLYTITPDWAMTPAISPVSTATPRQTNEAPDITRLVATAHAALAAHPLPRPLHRPWLPPLPSVLPITQTLPGLFDADEHFVGWPATPLTDWMHLPIAKIDRITTQPLLMCDLSRKHIQLLGVPPNGGRESALLATVLGLAASHKPGDIQFLVLDSGFTLKALAALPHDTQYFAAKAEALNQILLNLRQEMLRRQDAFNAVEKGVVIGNLADYRAYQNRTRPSDEPEMAYVLVLEDYLSWRKKIEKINYAALDILRDLIQNGPRYGIHLILTANRAFDVEGDNFWKSFYTLQFEMDTTNLKGMPSEREMLEAWANKVGRGFTEGSKPNRLEEAQAICVVAANDDAQQQAAFRLVNEIAHMHTRPHSTESAA